MATREQQSLPARPSSFDWRALVASPWCLAVAVGLLALAISIVSLQRTVLGVGVESDFTGTYTVEAQRIHAGEPLKLNHHPPGYPFVLAAAHRIAGDWLQAGLWISGISALAFMSAGLATWRRLAGAPAAWGAMLAFACSTPFFTAASVAASDMLFAALVYVLLLLVTRALDAPGRTFFWAGCGAVAACVLMTRSNGLAAVVVLAAPFMAPRQAASRVRNLAVVAVAFLVPLFAWWIYASVTGSPTHPMQNYLNIAGAAYFDPTRPWIEQKVEHLAAMTSLADVLAYDPPRLIRQLLSNLALMPFRAARSLTWMPLALLAIPGLAILLLRRRSPALLVCLAILGGITAIVGIMGFQARFHLILVPLVGAQAGVAVASLWERFAIGRAARSVLVAALLVAAGAAAARSYSRVLPLVEAPVQREFAEAIPYLRAHTESDATLVVRGPSLAFQTGLSRVFLPDVASASELREALCRDTDPAHPVYLYIGEMERDYRSALIQDLAARPVPWLEPVARGSRTDWTLYRFHRERLDDGAGQSLCTSGAERIARAPSASRTTRRP